jgi:hypothetical protein
MSLENLDLVRSILAAWEQGDFRKAEWADPEIEHATIGGLDTGTARSRRGIPKPRIPMGFPGMPEEGLEPPTRGL